MKIFLSLLLIFSADLYAKCDFAPFVSKVFSLSGPATVLLREMGLLKNEKLKGISIFNPVSPQEFSGKVYPGGVFLSQTSLEEFSGGVIFYDESRELNRILSPLSSVQGVEIKSRNLTPQESVNKTISEMSHFLQGCEKEVVMINQKVRELEKKLLEMIPDKLSVIFYLGEFHGERPPELVIVNDGVVKWLIDEKKIRTYPSTLAYVNWSAKLISQLPKTTLHVAVKDSAREMKKDLKRSSVGMTLIYPGSLVPGITQLEAFLYWAQTLKKK